MKLKLTLHFGSFSWMGNTCCWTKFIASQNRIAHSKPHAVGGADEDVFPHLSFG